MKVSKKIYKTMNSVPTQLCCFVCGGVRIRPVGAHENCFKSQSKHFYLHNHRHHLILFWANGAEMGAVASSRKHTPEREWRELNFQGSRKLGSWRITMRPKLGCCKIHIRRKRWPWNRKTRNWGTTSGSRRLSTPNWERIMNHDGGRSGPSNRIATSEVCNELTTGR